MKTILVTGATGFIGQHVVESLSRSGNKVVALTRSTSQVKHLCVPAEPIPTSALAFAKLFDELSCDTVLHLATMFVRDNDEVDLHALIDSNLQLGLDIAAACSRSRKRLVIAGSYYQGLSFGQAEPQSLYAASKQAFRVFLEYYRRRNLIDFFEIRLFDTFGPRDTRDKLIPCLMRAAYYDQEMRLGSPRKSLRLSYVLDVAEEIRELALGTDSSDTFVDTYPPIALGELVRICSEEWGTEIPVEWSQVGSNSDGEFSQAAMGNHPQIASRRSRTPLRSAIRQTWLDFLSRQPTSPSE